MPPARLLCSFNERIYTCHIFMLVPRGCPILFCSLIVEHIFSFPIRFVFLFLPSVREFVDLFLIVPPPTCLPVRLLSCLFAYERVCPLVRLPSCSHPSPRMCHLPSFVILLQFPPCFNSHSINAVICRDLLVTCQGGAFFMLTAFSVCSMSPCGFHVGCHVVCYTSIARACLPVHRRNTSTNCRPPVAL